MKEHRSVYLDCHATTPVDPLVLKAMLPYFCEHFGNPSSNQHRFGWRAEEAVKLAREKVAKAIGAAKAGEIVFTSGATESNNLAILGVARRYQTKGKHLITVASEHKAVLDPCRQWLREGGEVTLLPVSPQGLLDPAALKAALRPDTVLVSVMMANNEIGVIQPIAAIGRITRQAGVLLHCDAAQAVGKIPVDVQAQNIDLLSLSGHKVYAPKGVGALYLRRRAPRVSLQALVFGGGHESDRRSGTLNVPGIVALGAALELAEQNREQEAARLAQLRDQLWSQLADIDGIRRNGHPEHTLPGNLHISIANLAGDQLITALHDIAVSHRSACSTTSAKMSHVLEAVGLDEDLAAASLRFGLGRFTSQADIQYAAKRVRETIKQLQADTQKR